MAAFFRGYALAVAGIRYIMGREILWAPEVEKSGERGPGTGSLYRSNSLRGAGNETAFLSLTGWLHPKAEIS
jgi:hypothetical protein